MGDSSSTRRLSRLAESAYNSPYARAGAPTPHPNTDPYAPLRAKAIATLEAMGYDPQTMVERGIVWAEDQDPFGHVMQSQYMNFLGTCFHRVMESYDEFLDEKEYNDMILAKTVVPVVRRYELDIRRQVKYPDAVRAVSDAGIHQAQLLTWDSSLRRIEKISSNQPATVALLHCFRLSSRLLLRKSRVQSHTWMSRLQSL
jgi:acyl-CoA thioesterase FadM